MEDERTASFAMLVRFTAAPGQRDELAAVLLEAADALSDVSACMLYLVTVPDSDDSSVWVTEVWTDRSAHAASLQQQSARELIGRAQPLIAVPPDAVQLGILGGKRPW